MSERITAPEPVRPGDVVVLKCGNGHAKTEMCVAEKDDLGQVLCVWMTTEHLLVSARIAPAALERVR